MTAPSMPFDAPQYDESHALQTDPEAVLERARIMLGTRGFAVTVQGRRLLAQGPHLTSPSEPALLGAGRLVLDLSDTDARMASDLSGLVRLRWFVMFAPPVLAVALGAGMDAGGVEGALRPALINALIWMLVGPALAVWLRRRTERALTALLGTLTSA